MNVRLSQRIDALAPSATMAVAEKSRQLRERGIDVVAFGAGEPDFDTPQPIKDAACRALAAGDTKYPSPVSGKPPLRAAICDYLKRYCGLGYTPDQICATVGAKDAIFMTFLAVLEPGDEAIVPVPYWVSYPEQVKLAGGSPIFVRGAVQNDGKMSADELRRALTPRTRLLVLNTPSNPAGTVYSRRELMAVADVIRNTDVLVMSDEIYHRLVWGDEPFVSFASIPGMSERTVVVNGLSKSFAMTGWRLGYAAGPAPIIDALARLQGQTTSGPTSFVQTAAIAALNGDQTCVEAMRRVYQSRGERMYRALSSMPGVTCFRPRGAFFCFPDVSGTFRRLGVTDADGFSEVVLERAHVAVVSGVAFGAPQHVRLSYATSDAQIDEGMRRLARLLG